MLTVRVILGKKELLWKKGIAKLREWPRVRVPRADRRFWFGINPGARLHGASQTHAPGESSQALVRFMKLFYREKYEIIHLALRTSCAFFRASAPQSAQPRKTLLPISLYGICRMRATRRKFREWRSSRASWNPTLLSGDKIYSGILSLENRSCTDEGKDGLISFFFPFAEWSLKAHPWKKNSSK